MKSRWFPDPDSEFGHFDVRLPFYHHDTVNAKQGQSGSQFPRDVLTGHDEPFDFHASLDVLAAVSDELFDVGLLEVLAERPQIPPRFVDDEAIAIETVPVNVKLKGSWFGSRVLEIDKHPPLVGIGATWFRSMLGMTQYGLVSPGSGSGSLGSTIDMRNLLSGFDTVRDASYSRASTLLDSGVHNAKRQLFFSPRGREVQLGDVPIVALDAD